MCGEVYVGETERSLGERTDEHQKSVDRQDGKSALSQHELKAGHRVTNGPILDIVKIIDQESRKSHRKIKEAVHIQLERAGMNRNEGWELPKSYLPLLRKEAGEKVPSDLDAIVIGSGPGGLTTAAILAKSGKRVLVLEQHGKPGGCSHTFGLKGLQFDSGIHYVGRMSESDSSAVRVLLDQITEGQLQWACLDEDYDVAVLGTPDQRRWIPIRRGGEQYRRELLKHFPGEEQAVQTFLRKTKEVADGSDILAALKILPLWVCKVLVKTGIVYVLNSFFRHMSRSTKEVLDELTDNADLKTVFAHNFGDHGVLPSKSGFALQASVAEHFREGGYYPVGGASEIAFNIIPVINKAGGAVLCRAPVSQILIDGDGQAMGVRVVDKKAGEVDIHAPVIVSAAGVYNTYHKLLPVEVAQKTGLGDVLEAVSQSCSCLSVFVGLRGTKEELGLKAQNVWLFAGNDMEKLHEEYGRLTPEEASQVDPPVLFISFPSAKDPSWEQRNRDRDGCVNVVQHQGQGWMCECCSAPGTEMDVNRDRDGCVNVVQHQGQGWMCECCSGTGTGMDVNRDRDGCVNVVQEQGQGWMCECCSAPGTGMDVDRDRDGCVNVVQEQGQGWMCECCSGTGTGMDHRDRDGCVNVFRNRDRDGCVNVVQEQGQGWMCECCSGTGTGMDVDRDRDGCVNVVQEQGQGWMCECCSGTGTGMDV
ncbi:hypothetical protein Bbelb_446840 [Branchiostoma belcheri]|nr:hypothetical protein Bbelb_446840 [Branchiostoma belcheri]